jgi:uncharacterized SAM-binding protein YcdF (DUF218 family)
MFFFVSKVLGFFAAPSNLLLCLAFGGAALSYTRWRRGGRRIVLGSLVVIAVAGLSPFGNWLIAPLENRFPRWEENGRIPDGVVVLGGALSPDLAGSRGAPDLNEAADRITAALELARRYPTMRIVYSGGDAGLVLELGVEADQAADLLVRLGLPRERLVVEARSRNTSENAAYSKALAEPKAGERWLLVTSAYHMPRSIGIFRKAGFTVEAYPVDWRTTTDHPNRPFDEISKGLRRTDTACREWVGLFAYWLFGKTETLFPDP